MAGCCECGNEPSGSIKCREWLLSCTVFLYCWEVYFYISCLHLSVRIDFLTCVMLLFFKK